MNETAEVEVAAAIIFHNGKVLITQRYPEAHLGGLWEFPGGKRRPHETFEQCLERELREELGIAVRVGGLIQSITHRYPERTVHLNFYLCEWIGGDPKPLGCKDFAWVGCDELTQFDFPAADAAIVSLLQSTPEFWNR
ncbi:MAG: 8-oxo-dGTP diphosphatase MutT [Verrucomicrobiae bacterium]|nr:8-oxo-dGTP diphosphatase MutT [Verrucomicrobiae bacterium]MCX7722027.1 8-oxo-dGTP diphosphatase MutT [Verrucomicrobiae bacterium]MDW7979980.1 8-oxo-dGTP diphosphatase MutT [Verrucomicrobiales bacterium]